MFLIAMASNLLAAMASSLTAMVFASTNVICCELAQIQCLILLSGPLLAACGGHAIWLQFGTKCEIMRREWWNACADGCGDVLVGLGSHGIPWSSENEGFGTNLKRS